MDWALDRIFAKHGARFAGASAGLMLLTALLSARSGDPSLFNLLYPPDGVRNLAGYPGALVGGSLIDLFGVGSLLLPALLGNWFLSRRSRPPFRQYGIHALVLAVGLPVLLALSGRAMVTGLFSAGLAGQAGAQWIAATTGVWAGAALVALALGYALHRVIFLRHLRSALRDMRGFAAYGGRQCTAILAGMAEVIQALFAAIGRGLHGVSNSMAGRYRVRWGRLRTGLARWRSSVAHRLGPPRYAISRIKSSPRRGRQPSSRSPGIRGAGFDSQPTTAPAEDAFDAWFEPIPEAEHTVERPPRPAPAQQRAPGELNTGEPYTQWKERAARYRDNLDLDWPQGGKRQAPEDPFASDKDETETG